MNRIILCIVLASGLSSVGCWGWIYHEEVAPNYSLGAIDTMGQLELLHRDGDTYLSVVGPTVTGIGISESHIIVKQNPLRRPEGTNWSRTNYFIVVVPENAAVYPEGGIHGPMSFQEFLQARPQLSVPSGLRLEDVP